MNEPRRQFFGKYRGRVLDNVDPLFLGRIMVECPAISGLPLNWALPCAPYAGPNVGALAVPPIGASVWVEFEGGDPNDPIWAGCFWDEAQLPLTEGGAPAAFLKTDTVTVTLDDRPDSVGFDVSVQPYDGESVQISANGEGLAITVAAAQIHVGDDAVTIALGDSTLTLTPESVTLSTASASIALIEDMVVIKGTIITGDELA